MPYLVSDRIFAPKVLASAFHQDLGVLVPCAFIADFSFPLKRYFFPFTNKSHFLSCEEDVMSSTVWAWVPCAGTMMLPWAAPPAAMSPGVPTWLSGVLCCSRETLFKGQTWGGGQLCSVPLRKYGFSTSCWRDEWVVSYGIWGPCWFVIRKLCCKKRTKEEMRLDTLGLPTNTCIFYIYTHR